MAASASDSSFSSADSGNGMRRFPRDFIWGCCTSPTQVEGDTVNEWAGYVATDGTTPDDGPHHWRRYRYDFGCLADLNQNAYRLGFDWGRLQPGPCEPFDREVAFRYMEMLAELRSHGIEPFLTLFHFACPRWMAERGGWLHKDAPVWFANFVEQLAELTDGEVRWWITHNEPAVYAFMAYVMEKFPPRRKGKLHMAYRVMRQMQAAHAFAHDKIKERIPDAQVGITKHFKRFLPLRDWHPVDHMATAAARAFFDHWGLQNFVHYQGRTVSDFVGVNYYGRMRLKGMSGVSPITGFSPEELASYGADCDDMWEQDPAALADCLRDVSQRTGLPMFITESGVATQDEVLRETYLVKHISACHAALREGIDVRGFFYWSLLDNYEWSEGLAKRFGLLSVDFQHDQRRRELRPTAKLYGAIAGENALPSI